MNLVFYKMLEICLLAKEVQCVRKFAGHLEATVRRFGCQYPSTLNGLKTEITACIRNVSQADLQKVFVNKIKRIQACIDARGHHFQHLL
jgi:hypothetical protein